VLGRYQAVVKFWNNFFVKVQKVFSLHYFSIFQEKKEVAEDASSPSVDSVVAEPNATAKTDSSADNVPTILIFTVSQIESEMHYAKVVTCLTYQSICSVWFSHVCQT
jgi:hypothetical protein